jgi:hypothetical protein
MVTYLDGRMDRRHKNKPGQTTNSKPIDGEDGGIGSSSFHQTDSTSNTDKDEITNAQFHQYLESIGVSYHDFSLQVEDSGSDSEAGWPIPVKKNKKKNKNRKS